MSDFGVKRGEYKIIRVDGTEEVIGIRPTMRAIERAIGCDCCDTVILQRGGGQPTVVMIVDDTGMVDRKPVNPKATALYHRVCSPANPYSIHGDVAIAHDGDFAW